MDGQAGEVGAGIDHGVEPQKAATGKAARPAKVALSGPTDVGVALRSAFQAAVEEDIPQELLDLLKRLD